MYGIDISEHQGKNFDLSKYVGQFVIIRAGYWTNKDKCFDAFADKCEKLSIPYGVYWYSYAVNAGGGDTEAKACLDVIKNRKISCGVWIDMEDADKYKRSRGALTPAICTSVCKSFCDTIKNAGYHAGIYASRSWFGSFIRDTYGYDKWVAAWGNNDGKIHYDLSKECSIYQYHGSPLDADLMYVPIDWFSTNQKQNENRKTVEEIALEVINGAWGNGEQRKNLITEAGYNYNLVQQKVNEILGANLSKVNSIEKIATDVISGKYGNGITRRIKLAKAGYNYDEVQAMVNKLLG